MAAVKGEDAVVGSVGNSGIKLGVLGDFDGKLLIQRPSSRADADGHVHTTARHLGQAQTLPDIHVPVNDQISAIALQFLNRALDKPRTCQQICITFKQILKMAVADNYIGPGMYEMICSDINLPKYVCKEKRAGKSDL